MSRILPIATEPISDAKALLIFPLENFRSEQPGSDPRAHGAQAKVIAFFVHPDDHFERVPGLDGSVIQRIDYFDCAQAPEIAVEVSAFKDGVDIGTEEQNGPFS